MNNKSKPHFDESCKRLSEQLAEEAVNLIMTNDITNAVEKINVSLSFNPYDYRHYLNRCYCNLRQRNYNLAFADAEYVIRNSKALGHLFVAKLRAGQAASGLKNFRQAEDYLIQAKKINPENHHVKRELMRMKIMHLVLMGFKEKDAILALEKYPVTLQAKNYLTEQKFANNGWKIKCDFGNVEAVEENDEDMIYASDEDEKPTTIEIINRILNYKPGETKLQHIMTKPSVTSFINSLESSGVKKNDDLPVFNDKAIFVGNLNQFISDEILHAAFSQFGNVAYVYKPENAGYAFVNFETSQAASTVLLNSTYSICGSLVCVQRAQRKKRPTSFIS